MPEKKTHDLHALMESQNKKSGQRTIITGTDLKPDPPRIPFGMFAVDYATGGGIPLHGSTCLWGPESGGKTTAAMSVAKSAKIICWRCFHPQKFCTCSESALNMGVMWADVEGTFDRLWADGVGLKPEDYYYALADYGEQYINICDAALQSDDCGLLVLDSLAALIPESEFEADAEDQFIGVQARLIGRAVRKLKQRMIRERKNEHPCAVLFTNQMRTKIGQMFGNPETMPGGHAMKHEFSLLLRMSQIALNKSSTDKKYIPSGKDAKPVAGRFAFQIKKHKIQIVATGGQYIRMTETTDEHPAGLIVDDNVILKYAKQHEIVIKNGSKWQWFEKPTDKVENIRNMLMRVPDAYMLTMQSIVESAKQNRFAEEVADAEA